MKYLITSLLALFFATNLQAQSPNYVDFEWDIIKFGFVIPTGEFQDGGASFGGEIRYNATDNFSLGVSGQFAAFGSTFQGDVDIDVAASYLLVGDYYLKDNSSTRAFFGAGLGILSTGTLVIRNDNVEDVIEGTSGFGIAPRAGMEFGHVRLQGQYNIPTTDGHNSYFELTLAVTLWGGYKGG